MFNIFSMCFGTKNIKEETLPSYTESTSSTFSSSLITEQPKNHIIHENSVDVSIEVSDLDEIKVLLKKMNKKINNLDKKISTFKHYEQISKQVKDQVKEQVKEQVKDKDWYVKNIKVLLDNHPNYHDKDSQFINICNVFDMSIEYLNYNFDKKFYNICFNKIDDLLKSKSCSDYHLVILNSYHKQLKTIKIKSLTKNKKIF